MSRWCWEVFETPTGVASYDGEGVGGAGWASWLGRLMAGGGHGVLLGLRGVLRVLHLGHAGVLRRVHAPLEALSALQEGVGRGWGLESP